MSDFFMPTQNNVDQEAEKYRNAAKSVQNQEIEEYKQKQQQHLENWDRYGVNVPDEYYDAFNKIIAQAPTPEEAQEEAYKIGSAVKYSEAMGIPLLEAYQNVDAFNEAQFTDLQGQKGRFEALSDMLNLGRNNVKLGRLGQELMQAHGNNDTELANALMAEIDAINQQNQLMQDNAPRSWVMQALEAGAQSLPFTGVVAGAGIVGNFIAPAAGTAAAFVASSYLSAGTEYIDMIANGASPQTARLVATVSGGIQGLIEADLGISKSIVKSTARVIGKEAAENAAKKSVEEIGRKVFKRFHFGAGKKVLINYLENRGKDILGEGTEEFLQEITSIVGQEVAASLDDYDIPDDDFKSIVKQTTEAFRGGVLGALSMGFIPAGINAAADVREYKLIKDTAEVFESEEMFKNAAKDSPVFEGMSDEAKAETIHEVWQRAQNRKEEEANLEAQKIAEVQDAAEGSEELKTGDEKEGEEASTTQVTRDEESGELYTKDELYHDEEGNTTGGVFLAGNENNLVEVNGEKKAARYGYINWEFADGDQSKIIINDFKMAKGREGLRAEFFNDFAIQHPGVDIQWNTKGSIANDVKQMLIDNNPSGAKNGLNYYADTDAVIDAKTRAWVDREIDKNIYDVRKEVGPDGKEHLVKTKLTKQQRGAAIALLEAGAKRMGMSITDYVNKTFGNSIFGTREDFVKKSLNQNEDVNKKAGGVTVGVAQQGWKKYGQQVKAVIYAGEHADFSTWAHELAHIFQNQLDGKLKEEAEKAFKVVKGDWENSMYTFKDGKVMPAIEAFAYGFQDWLKTGKAENEQMQNIFKEFAKFIARAFNSLKDFINLTPEITSVYEQLLAGDDSLLKAAEMAVETEDRRYRAQMQKQTQEAEQQKQAEAEQQKKSEEAEREEASESTDFTEEKSTEEELADAENRINEVNNETEKTDNAIDNALENTNLTDEQKEQIAETLKDESSTIVEKAEATTEAAESAYDENVPYDLFQDEGKLLSQLIGEPSIKRMAESEERTRILLDLKLAQDMEVDGKDAGTIRRATGWENINNEWKYETDDSVIDVLDKANINKNLNANPDQLITDYGSTRRNLDKVLDAPELFKYYPILKNVRVSFYKAYDAQRSRLSEDGILLNTKGLDRVTGPESIKASLVYEIQKLIHALEHNKTKSAVGENIDEYIAAADALDREMRQAILKKNAKLDYDKAAIRERINDIMTKRGDEEARIVASRVLLDADQRIRKTLAQSKEEIKGTLLSQEENPDFLEATKKAQDLLFQNELTMYGIHNLSEEALRHAVKMGGLANPSMAVVDTEKNSFTNFGEVSLIPYNYMLEKGAGSKGTFGADIYSPRYPSLTINVTDEGYKTISSIVEAVKAVDENFARELEGKIANGIEYHGERKQFLYEYFRIPFLAEKGYKDFYHTPESKFSDEIRKEYKKLWNKEEGAKTWRELYEQFIESEYDKELVAELKEDLKDSDKEYNLLSAFEHQLWQDNQYSGKIDYGQTERKAEEIIDKDPELKKEFEKYVDEKLESIDKKERIFNGFTPSGNRRYLEHTLENVSKYMRQQELQGGESFYYGLGSTRAKFTPNFKTLNQIKKARDRLVTHEEFEKIKEEYNERFDNIIEELRGDNDFDTGAARFEEAFTYGKSDPIGYLEREYSSYGVHMTDELAQEILDFATALRVMPTEYFETKYTRPVTLNEFAGAIIPSNLSQDLKNTLANNGLMIEEYDSEAGNREEVTKAALQKFNETRRVLFQEAYHGSGADFDKFDTENFGLSGEGTMSFGYGTYVTDSEEIARDYANRQGLNFDKVKITDDNRLYYDIAFNISRGFTFEDAKEKLLESTRKSIEQRKDYIERVKASKLSEEDKKFKLDYSEKRLQEDIADLEKIEKLLPSLTVEDVYNKLGIKKRRYLYTVEIPDDGYIEWDRLYKNDEIPAIAKALRAEIEKDYSYGDAYIEWDYLEELEKHAYTMTGANLLNNIKNIFYGNEKEKKASKYLNRIGYAGIKYLAGTIHGNGNGAYNYVIFNDDDAKIVDKLLFQTQAELMNEARTFDSWQEFMEHCEAFHADDEVSPIPSDADAQWYQTFYETANGVQTEQEKNEEAVQAKDKKEGALPGAVDALFTTMIKSDPQMVDSFLQAVADIDAIDLDSEEWQQAENAEDAAQRDKIAELKDFINITLSDYNWQTALRRIQGGHEISEGLRKRLIGEMTDSFKSRDFRALYAEVMNDPQFAVAEEDSITATLNKKLKKYHEIVKPNDDISRWSPERRKQLAEQLANREIAAKIRSGSLKLDDELDAYIKSLNKQIKETQDQYNELEKETKADYQRIADKERRDLLKLHEQLLLARGKLNSRNTEINRKIAKGLKITDKYSRLTQNLNANYDELFRKYNDLRNTITINAEVQAALDRQEQVAGLREDLNAKQKEKNLTAEVKKMRIQLVKRTMRRVPFNRIDYNNARTVIAIQRMLEPNLLGGVNRFIGIDSPYLRGVISQIVTDSDYKESIMAYLNKNSKASQAFADFKKKLTELKSIKDFDSWTAKDRKTAIRYLPKENWVKDLNLLQLAKEREESIDLDIGMEEIKRTVYDEKTGEPKTYKDKEGNEHNVTETAFKLKANEEIERLVQDAVGADMFDKIVNMPFSEWTTEDLETLAQRIDEIYTEGRDLKAAKDEARKKEAAVIRKRIEDAIKETGITINDDDTPEEKERKQKQIDKILGMSEDLKGTEAAKPKGFKAKITRLLHSYADMNVLRFARMLDGQSEGENVRLLYRKEDDCYNVKQRSMNSRAEKINKVMKDNNITEGDLAEVVKVPSLGTEFTVDELLYFLAADKDYAEDEKKLQKGLVGIDANDDYAATSRNAVMFGNMMSDMMSQEEKESWLQLDKDMEEALRNDTLTQEQKEQQAAGFLDTKPGTTRYILACHAKWEVVLGAANNYLSTHPEYKALMEAIEADYAEQYDRMNEVSINEFNMPIHRVKAYVPLVRRESNGDTNENQVKEDLLGAAGVGKQWADRGMTQRRVQISPLNQKPVQTGLFRTWGDSIERTEHFIAYAPYVRQLNTIYKSRDASYTRRFIESRYGASAIKYLDEYINEVANPNAGRIRERGAEWLHVLRGKIAPAYLGWKASAIIKQGLTSPWPYMQFVNPAEYVAAAMKFTFNPEMREAIKEKSVFMKMRRMDPVNDLIDEMTDSAKTKLDRGWSNFSRIGMQGLELIDWACVAPGWLACYEKKYNQLQNASNARYEAKMAELKERNMYADVGTSEYLTPQQMEAEAKKEMLEDIEAEAVRYADDCTRACQPSNRATDLAPLFKNGGEFKRAFLQFQTSLNVIWQNIRYDMPYAVKNKEFTRIAGTVIGYVCAGIFMNSVMEGIGGDDDDDETQALRNLIYYSTTQFTDAIPIFGSEITNTVDQLITGKRGFYGSGTDMTPSATKLLSVLTNAKKGNWQKAAELTAEGIGLYLGAPVSGAKEINKLLGKPLDNGDVNLVRGISDVYGIAGDILEE